MEKTILVPTDFSEVCNNAMNHACDLAKHLQVKVIALHVVTKETKSYLDKEKLKDEALEQRLKDYVNGKKAEFEVETDYVLQAGSIFDVISEVSKNRNSIFIVLGTHGKVGFQRLTGSYALKVINSTNIPSIIVQKKALEGGYKNIVFPLSAYSNDLHKTSMAAAISKAFGSKIHLFPKYENDKFAKNKLYSLIKTTLHYFDEKNVDYCKELPDESAGNFSKQVIDYSVVNNADLIVIVTGSKTSLPMFDSNDEQIIFNSVQIPVMCINPARVDKKSFGGGSWSGL